MEMTRTLLRPLMMIFLLCIGFSLASQSSTDWQALLGQGEQLLNNDRPEEAITALDRAIMAAPDKGVLHARRGMASLELGDIDRAVDHINKGIQLDPEDAVCQMAYVRMVLADGKMNVIKRSKPAAMYIVESRPDLNETWITKAQWQFTVEDHFGALRTLDAGLEQLGEDIKILAEKGRLAFEIGNAPIATDALNRVLALEPDNSEALLTLGQVQFNQGLNREAIASFDKVIASEGTPELYNLRGLAKSNVSDFISAIADFDRAIAINPEYTEAYFNRAHALFRHSEFDASIADLNTVISMEPENAVAYTKRAMAKIMMQDQDGACIDLLQAVTLGDESATQPFDTFCKN